MMVRECKCPMRDGAHEYICSRVGEYEYVHCMDCDEPTWMCAMALSRCHACRIKYEGSKEYAEKKREAMLRFMHYNNKVKEVRFKIGEDME